MFWGLAEGGAKPDWEGACPPVVDSTSTATATATATETTATREQQQLTWLHLVTVHGV